jgi:hypothetical protein
MIMEEFHLMKPIRTERIAPKELSSTFAAVLSPCSFASSPGANQLVRFQPLKTPI